MMAGEVDSEENYRTEETEPSELNRLLPESEFRAEMMVMNNTPSTSSPSGSNKSNSRRLANNVPMEDVDKITSSPENDGNDNDTPEPRAPAEDDVVDECSRLNPQDDPVSSEPKSGEYTKIMELLKEAEAEADPEYEVTKRRMEYLTKYNPRNPDSGLSFVDYCCNLFQCCALCIEG